MELKLEDLKAGARVKIDKEKRNPHDFVLWFKGVGKHKNHLMLWNSPWGKGFPGWHIECSAMSIKYLSEHFDIHTGGIDHISVHHTNEIAQTEAVIGKKWVNYWLHSNHLILKEGKMAKSGGNILILSDLEKKGFNPMEFRYLCLGTHYRKKLIFDIKNMETAQQSYQRLKNIISEINDDKKINEMYLVRFKKAINDDLNTSKALQILWNFVRDEKAKGKLRTIKEMDKVFGLDLLKRKTIKIPAEVKKLITKRENAREKKDWKKADDLRKKIKKLGYNIEDTKGEVKIKKI